MTQKPLIGITLDWKENGSFADRPFYAMEQDYFTAVDVAGGIPMAIPCKHTHGIDLYVEKIDGLLAPGGNFASPENWYVSDNGKSPYAPSPRAAFEIDLISKTLKAGKPVLGICAGMQIMAGIFDCKMTENIHKHLKTDIDHLHGKALPEFAYDVDITPDTLLHKIMGKTCCPINSHHQEAVVSAPEHIRINAIATDGCIQGIEIPQYDFAIGVQWHPEVFLGDDKNSFLPLFQAFIKAAS